MEGGYVAGVPIFSYDPNFGFGLGARLYLSWRKTRSPRAPE
ncbi:MAG: DUF5982 domain-containing protein [Polyangiaceae bacterium]